MTALYTTDGRGNGAVLHGTERECRQWAAHQFGRRNLRGLRQVPTMNGVLIYDVGADDHDGDTVELW